MLTSICPPTVPTYTPAPDALRLINAARDAFGLPPVSTIEGPDRARAVERALDGATLGIWRIVWPIETRTDAQMVALATAWRRSAGRYLAPEPWAFAYLPSALSEWVWGERAT